MGRLRRSRTHKGIKHTKKQFRTRRRARDLDQVHEDLQRIKDGKKPELLMKDSDSMLELPGMGDHYCTECARFFVNADALEKHLISKQHKKRVKKLLEEPYSIQEAELAVGLTTDNGRRRTDNMVQ